MNIIDNDSYHHKIQFMYKGKFGSWAASASESDLYNTYTAIWSLFNQDSLKEAEKWSFKSKICKLKISSFVIKKA